MENQLVNKLWKSSNALFNYAMQEDDLGMGELKPKIAIPLMITALVAAILIVAWLQ